MIEIALCLAVIGFALTAIIGILPLGLQVQQENREETIVGQDGSYFLEAIRSGADGLDELANHVERIFQVTTDGSGNLVTNPPIVPVNGAEIVGRLSDPNTVHNYAYVRALAGAATENGRDSGTDMGFRYLLSVEVRPVQFYTNDLAAPFTQTLQTNLHEVRLAIRYPLRPDDRYGSGKQILRALVAGKLDPRTNGLYFFMPTKFEPLP